MNNKKMSKKGFTLVEIMIVVVIIGLLAAIAVPGFRKVRNNTIGGTMDNDARLIISAAQQYFLENDLTVVNSDDLVGAGLYMEELSRGNSVTAAINQNDTFSVYNDNYDNANDDTAEQAGANGLIYTMP